MLSTLIGNRTEPSPDKKTMLAAANRFLPGALRGVLQAVLEFTGFSQSVVSIDSLLWLCLTVCLYQGGWDIVVYDLHVWMWRIGVWVSFHLFVFASKVVSHYLSNVRIQTMSIPCQGWQHGGLDTGKQSLRSVLSFFLL